MGRKKQSGTQESRSGNGAGPRLEFMPWSAALESRRHMGRNDRPRVSLPVILHLPIWNWLPRPSFTLTTGSLSWHNIDVPAATERPLAS
jgi:hypothetical protein